MWFDVDKAGLAALLEARGKAFALFELIQNAWDAQPQLVTIELRPIPGEPYAFLKVEDDSAEGWTDSSSVHTMFGRSRRAGDPTRRGRFSLGEKLALSVCRRAKVVIIGETFIFDETGRHHRETGRDRGTLVEGEMRMTRDELAGVQDALTRLIPPIETTFNGKALTRPPILKSFTAKLQTVISDADGNLRPSMRQTQVDAYAGDPGGILELGIPVCDADWPWRLNVLQKVPLNLDRNSVTDAFRRALQVAAVNAMAESLNGDQAAESWVSEAIGDSRVQSEALKQIVAQRFGERAVVAVPGDPIANATAEANGASVIHGGALSAGAWANVRKHALIPSTSSAFPTPKPADQAATPKVCPLCKQPIRS